MSNPHPPGRIRRIEGFGYLDYGYRWMHPAVLLLLIFTLFWNALLSLFWKTIFLSLEKDAVVAMAFGLLSAPYSLIGLGLAYFSLCLLVNRTSLQLDAENLTVQHGPLPWRGNVSLPRAEIRQFYVMRKLGGSRKKKVLFDLNVILQSGEWVNLLRNQESGLEMKYLEFELEKEMGIENVPVPEEWTP